MNQPPSAARTGESPMDTIIICDLEVQFHVGVTPEERTAAQRLLISIEMESDFRRAAGTDDLGDTIDYASLCQRVQHFGDDCHWQLIETLAVDLAEMILTEFGPRQVIVEVKKFVIPQARHVAVRAIRRADITH